MGDFSWIRRAFSKGADAQNRPGGHDIPETTRNRIVTFCFDEFGHGLDRTDFWGEIYRFLLFRTGTTELYATSRRASGFLPARSHIDEILYYLKTCSGEHFLDFVEDIFRSKQLHKAGRNHKAIVDSVNQLLGVDDLPYQVSHFVYLSADVHPWNTPERISAYPKVIVVSNHVVYDQAVKPVLALLQQPHFKSANEEFLEALSDHRKGRYGDSLSKASSAFESVLKVICERNRWPYDNDKDTASKLVKILLERTSLEPYFEQMLMIVPTLRNRLSSSHGGGVKPRQAPEHLCEFALNATASAILLVVREAGV